MTRTTLLLLIALMASGVGLMTATQNGASRTAPPARPQGPCDSGETAVIASVGTAGAAGSGITLATALTRAHAAGTQVGTDRPTPGRPNAYSRRR